MKRFFTVLIAAAILSPLPVSSAVVGDINQDGKIDLIESVYALQVASGVYPTIDDSCLLTGQGLWEDGVVYNLCDVVTLSEIAYACTTVHTSETGTNAPPNTTYWTVLSIKGDTGPDGPIAGANSQLVYNDNGIAAGSEIYFDKNTNNVGIGVTPTSSYQLTVTGDQTDFLTGYFENFDNSGVGYALYGEAKGSGGTTHYGVYGKASGATTNYAGYFAGDTVITTNAAIGTTPGTDTRLKIEASGNTTSPSTYAGYFANNNSEPGTDAYGLQLMVTGDGGTDHFAISGEASGAVTYNTAAFFKATGNSGTSNYGVNASAGNASFLNYGGYFKSVSNTQATPYSYGVKGSATTTLDGTYNYGVYGNASGPTNTNYGVYGDANSISGAGNIHIGVYGKASGGATNYAGYFEGFVYMTENVYVAANVTALSFTDRTPYPKDVQTAYDAVLSMQRLPDDEYDEFNKENQLDHSTLHEFVQSADGEYRDLSATVSAQNEVIKDLIKRINELEAQLAAK